jgi:hypothetical protein
MWFKMVVKFALPVEHLLIMLKTQFEIHNNINLKYSLWSVQKYALQI